MCRIQKLPNELLLHILASVTDLDATPPSTTNFSLRLSAHLTNSPSQPLKTLSLVSKRWREAILPSLFKHARINLTSEPRWLVLCAGLSKHLKTRCKKTNKNLELVKKIEGLASDFEQPNETRVLGLTFLDEWDVDIPIEYLHSIPSPKIEVEQFLTFILQQALTRKVKSLVVHAPNRLAEDRSNFEECLIYAQVKSLWRTVFNALSLDTIIVAAPPSTMAALSGSTEREWDSWLFRMDYHYLKFSKAPQGLHAKPESSQASPEGRSREVFLYNILPWEHMAYNEGTYLRGYGHYEYHWKKPPVILPTLIEWLVKEKMSPKTPKISSFEYIAAFPYAQQVWDISSALAKLEHLRKLTVKLADPDLLGDKDLVGKAQPSDVYAEWEECYKLITRHVLAQAKNGMQFVSSDTKHELLRKQVRRCIKQTALVPMTFNPVEQETDGLLTWTCKD